MRGFSFWVAALILLTISSQCNSNNSLIDIKGMSLKDILSVKITSLSRKSQSIESAAAAIYVLTREDIKRTGASSIPEALRYVPGVEVARLQANQWAISIRGFNSRTANKLLVMIDGRSVYSPLFSGVLWEEKDVMLADVDRIEIIRGPGGTLWGSNAVNGVINIITLNSSQTQGSFVELAGGETDNSLIQARYGFQIGDSGSARVYFKQTRTPKSDTELNDSGKMQQFGFRYDTHFSNSNFTLQGDSYVGQIGEDFGGLLTQGQEYSGSNLLLRWDFNDQAKRKHQLVAYFDKTNLEVPTLIDKREIWNFDYQMQLNTQSHEIVMGTGVRLIEDDIQSTPFFSLVPQTRDDTISNVFVQFDYHPENSAYHFIYGSKFEKNDYTGGVWQPSLRYSYDSSNGVWWGALSRAARVPSRLELDLNVGEFNAAQSMQNELLTMAEIGWRYAINNLWQFDLTLYRGKYEDLFTSEVTRFANNMQGYTQGFEASLSYQATSNWLLRGNYTRGDISLSVSDTSLDRSRSEAIEGSSPEQMLQLISNWHISDQWEFNSFLRHVSQLETQDADDYTVFDFTLSWQLNKKLQLRLIARHLGDNKHREWRAQTSQVEQDYKLAFTWEL